MTDIVSELSARAIDQIVNEGHDISNDSLIGEHAPATTIPVGNGILGEIPRMETESSPLSPEEESMLEEALENEHHEIPENSATITIDETTSRFSGAIWYEQIRKQTITLAGVGGIGRFGNLINF